MVLLETIVNVMSARQSIAFPISFLLEHEDVYILTIDINYTSKYFSEQYSAQLVSNRDNEGRNLKAKNLRGETYEVTDPIRKLVVKKDRKQFKFECVKPFEIK